MTDPADRNARIAASAAQVLVDSAAAADEMVLAVQFRPSAPVDDVQETIRRLLESPAVARVGLAPLGDDQPTPYGAGRMN